MTISGILGTVLVLLLLGGCRGGSTSELGPPRTLTQEQRPTAWATSTRQRLGLPDMRGTAKTDPTQSTQAWQGVTPVGWEELPAQPARFRDAVWRVAGSEETECYLSAGVGGGVATNLSRWYTQQFGITEVPAFEALPVVEVAGRTGRLVELVGTFLQKPGQAMLLAFYVEGEQLTTLKFTGPAAVVVGNREKFLGLAKSLRLASVSPNPSAPPIQPGQAMPTNHPPVGGLSGIGTAGTGVGGAAADPHGTGATPQAAPFAATVPDGWTAKPGGRVLHHSFGTDGEIYVSQLGGGLRPTLDIWRSEVGLAAMSDAEWAALGKVPMLGAEATLLEVAGDFRSMSGKQIAGARLLVAALLEGNSILFAKLVGTAGEVQTQRDGFLKFCASLRRTP